MGTAGGEKPLKMKNEIACAFSWAHGGPEKTVEIRLLRLGRFRRLLFYASFGCRHGGGRAGGLYRRLAGLYFVSADGGARGHNYFCVGGMAKIFGAIADFGNDNHLSAMRKKLAGGDAAKCVSVVL